MTADSLIVDCGDYPKGWTALHCIYYEDRPYSAIKPNLQGWEGGLPSDTTSYYKNQVGMRESAFRWRENANLPVDKHSCDTQMADYIGHRMDIFLAMELL